jgi:hypothetical protein
LTAYRLPFDILTGVLVAMDGMDVLYSVDVGLLLSEEYGASEFDANNSHDDGVEAPSGMVCKTDFTVLGPS